MNFPHRATDHMGTGSAKRSTTACFGVLSRGRLLIRSVAGFPFAVRVST